jgi:hypothetical protein
VQLYQAASLALHRLQHRPRKTKTAKTVVVVPAHNEQDSIGRTIQALLAQTRRPDRIIVVADNCTDKTVEIARRFGRRVTVVETVGNKDRKVGALATAWREYVAYGFDYMLGVDADTVLAPHTLEDLERELEANPKVGGVMARYTFDTEYGATKWARLLIRLQRMEFAAWTLDMLHRKRNTYVLGGQATLFRVSALQEVVEGEKRFSPWDPEAQVEDMELTWALTARGWETKVSSSARAFAGPMITLKSLWAQRRKWDEGIRLLLGTKLGAATAYPLADAAQDGAERDHPLAVRRPARDLAGRPRLRVELDLDRASRPRRAAQLQARPQGPGAHADGSRPRPEPRRRRALPDLQAARLGDLLGDGDHGHPPRRLGPAVQGRGPARGPDQDCAGGGGLTCATP